MSCMVEFLFLKGKMISKLTGNLSLCAYSLSLKANICYKWVCGTETSCLTTIPSSILLCCIAECGLSGSNGQAHNLKFWTKHVHLPIDPTLFAFSETVHGKEMGNQHWNSRVCSLTSCCPPTWPSDCADCPGYPGKSRTPCTYTIIMRLNHEWRSLWRNHYAQYCKKMLA